MMVPQRSAVLAIALIAASCVTAVGARNRDNLYPPLWSPWPSSANYWQTPQKNVSHPVHHHGYHYAGHYSDGRPRAWCGWFMRHEVGSDPGPEFNLARNWSHWGHPATGPAPGVIGVMPHHVFRVIEVLSPGHVLAISGNDGHAVRTRPRSTGGVIAWRQ